MQASDSAVAASTQRPPAMPAAPAASEARLQRALKIVVVGLAVLLFAGLALVVWRVIYLASSTRTQPAAPAPAIRPEQRIALPAGAQIRSISLSGDRLAVHYEVGTRAGIAVLDLQTGRVVTDIAVDREPADGAPQTP